MDHIPVYWKIRRTGKFFPHAAVSLRVRVKIKDKVKFRVRVTVRSRVKIRVRIRARVEVRVKVMVSVSYVMTKWRWEEFSRCNKFPTTPALPWPPLSHTDTSFLRCYAGHFVRFSQLLTDVCINQWPK